MCQMLGIKSEYNKELAAYRYAMSIAVICVLGRV